MQNASCKMSAKLAHWFWRRRRLTGFYNIWAWRPSGISDHNQFIKILYNCHINARYEISLKLDQ